MLGVKEPNERYRALVKAVVEIARERGEVHYTSLAFFLGVSAQYASQIARAAADLYPNELVYRRGTLVYIKKDKEEEDEV